VLDLFESGRLVAEVAKALGISDQTIYTWCRQDRIDKGLERASESSNPTPGNGGTPRCSADEGHFG
jgi:transposase-like protein